jgi:hypothetical protein
MSARRAETGSGLQLAVLVIALLVAVYFAFQVIGVLVRLALLAAVALIAVAAYRAARRR